MKKIIFVFLLFVLVGCNKDVPTPQSVVTQTPTPTPTYNYPTLSTGYYIGKTSYELKTPILFADIETIRNGFGIQSKGIFNGTNNLGYVYIDMNGDGYEDIFYPYSSANNTKMIPDVFINNKIGGYTLDNSMLPIDFSGTVLTRKTLVGDYNNDSLPDLFLINSGWDAAPFTGEMCTLLLSDKSTHKYKLGDLSALPTAFWHGGASGDLDGDGDIDIIVLAGNNIKVLYNDGKGNFNVTKWNYSNGSGYITGEIVDVNKDGQNDIILSGDEGTPPPGIYSKSTIYFNSNNTFNQQSIICEPNANGWRMIMDIVCSDLDGDGTNEIILDRTGDNSGVWYGGYTLSTYKSTDSYKTFKEVSLIKNNISQVRSTGNWITKLVLSKDSKTLVADVSTGNGINVNSTKTWKQNETTKIFE